MFMFRMFPELELFPEELELLPELEFLLLLLKNHPLSIDDDPDDDDHVDEDVDEDEDVETLEVTEL
jgi:hypothetical protein